MSQENKLPRIEGKFLNLSKGSNLKATFNKHDVVWLKFRDSFFKVKENFDSHRNNFYFTGTQKS